MAGHSRWKTLQARRLAKTGDAGEHAEYDIETLRRLGNAMGVRFRVIVGNEEADHEENLLVS
jgi:hypothetical protein